MEKATIVFGCDYGASSLKTELAVHFEKKGYTIKDCGAFDASLDYIDITKKSVSTLMGTTGKTFGVFICGSGIGVSIAANRYPEIRAALCHSPAEAMLARQKSNANVLCLGGDTIETTLAIETLEAFLTTSFLDERKKLIEKLSNIFMVDKVLKR